MMSEFKAGYTQLAANMTLLNKHCPDVMKDFAALHTDAVHTKNVSTKNKELIALGIAIALHCEGCILSHVRSLVNAGATMTEIAEAVEVAILMGGGPATVYGGKALAVAEALFAEKT